MDVKPHISITVVGPHAAGKSTFCGRLLYDAGRIDDRLMSKLRQQAEQDMRPPSTAFAYAADYQQAERHRGTSIVPHVREFHTRKYHYTLIDTPGNPHFFKNMATGVARADTAILVFPAAQTAPPSRISYSAQLDQLRNQARLLCLLGMKQLVVCVTKLDVCSGGSADAIEAPYSEARFLDAKHQIHRALVQGGWCKTQVEREIPIIPLSGLDGTSVLTSDDLAQVMPWWEGVDVTVATTGATIRVKSLLDALDDIMSVPVRNIDAPLRAPISRAVNYIGFDSTVITTRIEQGSVALKDKVIFLPTHTPFRQCQGTVSSIQMHHAERNTASAGDTVGIGVKGLSKSNKPSRGDVMIPASEFAFKACDTFVVQAMVVHHPSRIKLGYSPNCFVRTANAVCRLVKINFKTGKKSIGGEKVLNPDFIEQGDVCELVFKPSTRPFVVDTFTSCEGLSRVAMFEGAVVCMVGKVTAINLVPWGPTHL